MSKSFQDNLFNLKKKTVLVTGGASGIGKIITECLFSAGAEIIVTSRNIERNKENLNNKILKSDRVNFFKTDVSNENDIQILKEKIEKKFEKINVIVNNAGTSWGAKLGNFPFHAWEKVFSTNVSGVFHLSQLLIPVLKKSASKNNPSKIINIGSVMGTSAYGDGAYSYSASKAAIHHLTKIMAKELANKKILVNAIAPGPFESNMTKFALDTTDKKKSVEKKIPLGRIGNKNDLEGLIIFLSSNASNYITGSIIPLDGGLHVSTGSELFSEAKS